MQQGSSFALQTFKSSSENLTNPQDALHKKHLSFAQFCNYEMNFSPHFKAYISVAFPENQWQIEWDAVRWTYYPFRRRRLRQNSPTRHYTFLTARQEALLATKKK